MNQYELQDIMECVSKFDLTQMDLQDQALYLSSVCEFAEKMKPLVAKYSRKLPDNSKFIFRI